MGVRVAKGTDTHKVYNQPSNRNWLQEGEKSFNFTTSSQVFQFIFWNMVISAPN